MPASLHLSFSWHLAAAGRAIKEIASVPELNGSTGGDHAELIKLKRRNTCRYRAAPRDMPSRQM
jgi:hypothetical protein